MEEEEELSKSTLADPRIELVIGMLKRKGVLAVSLELVLVLVLVLRQGWLPECRVVAPERVESLRGFSFPLSFSFGAGWPGKREMRGLNGGGGGDIAEAEAEAGMFLVVELSWENSLDIISSQLVQRIVAAASFVWMACWTEACWFAALAQMLPKGIMQAMEGMTRVSAVGNHGTWESWRMVKITV